MIFIGQLNDLSARIECMCKIYRVNLLEFHNFDPFSSDYWSIKTIIVFNPY